MQNGCLMGEKKGKKPKKLIGPESKKEKEDKAQRNQNGP